MWKRGRSHTNERALVHTHKRALTHALTRTSFHCICSALFLFFLGLFLCNWLTSSSVFPIFLLLHLSLHLLGLLTDICPSFCLPTVKFAWLSISSIALTFAHSIQSICWQTPSVHICLSVFFSVLVCSSVIFSCLSPLWKRGLFRKIYKFVKQMVFVGSLRGIRMITC